MNTRYRWFEIGISSDFNELINRLASKSFESNSYDGYVLLERGHNIAVMQYFWRVSVALKNINEQGDTELIYHDSVESMEIEFIKFENQIILRVENPGRSIRQLMNSLETIVQVGFYQKNIVFNYKDPLVLFSLFDEIVVNKMVVSGLVINNSVLAKIELSSISGIEEGEVEFLRNQQYTVDLVAYDLVYKKLTGSIIFSKSGLVRIDGVLKPKILEALELSFK